MKNDEDTLRRLKAALDATWNLLGQGLEALFYRGNLSAQATHAEIEIAPFKEKSGPFYRQFLPLQKELISLLATSYRRLFKLGIAHPREAGPDPDAWAWTQLQPAIRTSLEWIRDWYILACEGENQSVRRIGTVPFTPGGTASVSIPDTLPPSPSPKDWRAPAWLYGISAVYHGIGHLKTERVPPRDAEEKLSASYTRLLLKGAKRVFLRELHAAFDTVRNEEISAHGAIPAEKAANELQEQEALKPQFKGLDGLGPKKTDMSQSQYSQYLHELTDKQLLALTLRIEYRLSFQKIASRMQIDPKTAHEHVNSALRKIDQARSNEKRKTQSAKSDDDLG